MKKMKNGGMASLKFMFCILIIIMHWNIPFTYIGTYYFEGAYVTVDFFFLVIGFYMIDMIRNEEPVKTSVIYGINRIKRFLPWVLVESVLLGTIVLIFYCDSLYDTLESVIKLLMDCTLLECILPRSIHYNGTLWFISASIFVGTGTHYLLSRYKKDYIILCPIISLAIYNYIIKSNGSLDAWNQTGTFFRMSVSRAFAGISLGCFLRHIVDLMNHWTRNNLQVFVIRMGGGIIAARINRDNACMSPYMGG